MFKFKEFRKSLIIALFGIKRAFKTEQSFRYQIYISLIVCLLMIIFPLSDNERIIIVFLIGAVLGFELLNSQIEKILDIIQPNNDSKVKIVKDFSAAAVLIVVIGSVIIGLIIFLPYLLNLFKY